VTGLTPGVSYDFQVDARSLVGYGPVSSTITELAAQIPDEPTGLSNVAEVTLADRAGLTWTAPVFDGGSPVIDYRVWFDNASAGASFVELVSGLQSTSFTATGLTQGQTYQFKVESRNIYGYSASYSNVVTILVA